MKKIVLIAMILLLPVYSEAAYKIFLKNGSVISGVNSYDEKGNEVNLYFSTGSMTLLKKDILKIEGTAAESMEAPFTESPEAEEKPEKPAETKGEAPVQPPVQERTDDNDAKVNSLKAELDSVTVELRTTEEEEANLVSTINEKTGRRFNYNLIQLKQLEKELEPLRQELHDVQQKKMELMQRRSSIEEEIRAVE
jgi:chromosome segregation ATPase